MSDDDLRAELAKFRGAAAVDAHRIETLTAQLAAVSLSLHQATEPPATTRAELTQARLDHQSEVDALRVERNGLARELAQRDAEVPGLSPGPGYTLEDVALIEAARGRPYAKLRETVEQRDQLTAELAASEALTEAALTERSAAIEQAAMLAKRAEVLGDAVIGFNVLCEELADLLGVGGEPKEPDVLVDAVDALCAEVERLRAWQLAVAEGMGYVNRAEGQSGYEAAEPDVILSAWNDTQQRLTVETDGDEARAEIQHLKAEAATAYTRGSEERGRAQSAAIVGTVGGFVDGMPTQSINFLQRLRQLVAVEAALKAALPALEEDVEELSEIVRNDDSGDPNGPLAVASAQARLDAARRSLATPLVTTRVETCSACAHLPEESRGLASCTCGAEVASVSAAEKRLRKFAALSSPDRRVPELMQVQADLADMLDENKRLREALEGLWSLADKGSPQDEIIAAAIAPKPKRSRR